MFHIDFARTVLSAVLCALPITLLYSQDAASVNVQQEQESFLQAFLEDVDVMQSELINFGAYFSDAVKPYKEIFQKEFEGRTADSELHGEVFDKIVQTAFQVLRQTAVDFFTPEQYAKLTTRIYQVTEFPNVVEGNAVEGIEIKALQLFLFSEIIELSDEQKAEIAAMQREVLIEWGMDVEIRRRFEQEIADLKKELAAAENDEQKTELQKKIAEKTEKYAKSKEQTKMNLRLQEKFDKLFTSEQKGKLAKLREEMPDYLKKVLVKQGGKTGESAIKV